MRGRCGCTDSHGDWSRRGSCSRWARPRWSSPATPARPGREGTATRVRAPTRARSAARLTIVCDFPVPGPALITRLTPSRTCSSTATCGGSASRTKGSSGLAGRASDSGPVSRAAPPSVAAATSKRPRTGCAPSRGADRSKSATAAARARWTVVTRKVRCNAHPGRRVASVSAANAPVGSSSSPEPGDPSQLRRVQLDPKWAESRSRSTGLKLISPTASTALSSASSGLHLAAPQEDRGRGFGVVGRVGHGPRRRPRQQVAPGQPVLSVEFQFLAAHRAGAVQGARPRGRLAEEFGQAGCFGR